MLLYLLVCDPVRCYLYTESEQCHTHTHTPLQDALYTVVVFVVVSHRCVDDERCGEESALFCVVGTDKSEKKHVRRVLQRERVCQ